MHRAWLKNMFLWFGEIVDVFIPDKRRKFTNSRFGFVRFVNEEDADFAIRRINGTWCLNCKLLVRRAVFG